MLAEVADSGKSDDDARSNHVEERSDNPEDDISSDQVLTLAIHDKSPLQTNSDKQPNSEVANSSELRESSDLGPRENVLTNGEQALPDSRRKGIVGRKGDGKGSAVHVDQSSSSSAPRSQDCSPQRVKLHYLYFFFGIRNRKNIIKIVQWYKALPYINSTHHHVACT